MIELLVTILSLVLTEAQIDEVLKHVGALIVLGTAFVSLLGTIFSAALLYFQRKNKADLTKRIDDNTSKTEAGIAKSEEAILVSNGHNEKIAAVMALHKPQEVVVVNSPSNPVPVEDTKPL